MTLMQRRSREVKWGQSVDCAEDTKKSRGSSGALWSFLTVMGIATVLVVWGEVKHSHSAMSAHSNSSKIPGIQFEIDAGISCIVEFAEAEAGSTKVSLGPHKATLVLEKACQNPGLWIRLEGDALVPVVLHEGTTGTTWDGAFTLPFEGNFSLVAYWYGCDGSTNLQTRKTLMSVIAQDSVVVGGSIQSLLFPSSVWISSKGFAPDSGASQPYVFHNPQVPTTEAKLLKTSESFVSEQSATFPETKFYKFSELSNYELVCWIGSESAELLRVSFLQLRSLVNTHQRPFKFHYYESKSFHNPDLSWSKDTKERFRKCKHILISMDEVQTPTTQTEYVQHVTTFINHLLKAFPDDTFPIWMLSVMESPTNPTNCYSPSLPRSSEHPCNSALKDLFQKRPFPERVRFLDSTEITLPQLGENPKDVATAVALRIFVVVGKQVAAWRDKGQIGDVEGLRRGDHLEPNFELVAYTGWEP